MTLKILGGALLFVSCAAAGLRTGGRLKKRVVLLGEMAQFLAHIRTELTYRRERSLTLLRRAVSAHQRRELRIDLPRGAPAPEAVNAAVKRFERDTAELLTEQEREVFAAALRCVGAQDAAEQTEQLRCAEELLDQAKQQAEEKAAEEVRIFRALGVCAGCAAVLFLL